MSAPRDFDTFVRDMAAAEARMGGPAWRGVYEQLETPEGQDNLTNLYNVYQANNGGESCGSGDDDGEYDWTSMY